MSTIALHSVQPLTTTKQTRQWRIASAVVPAALADITVTREETRELPPARILLLETVRLLEQEYGYASVRDLANLSGIGDEALMAGILVPLAEQGLLIVDGESVRQNPRLTVKGEEARIVVEREEQVCVFGTPPVPLHGIDRGRFRQLRAFDSDNASVAIDCATLEMWRTAFWDERTQRLQLNEPLKPRLYVLESTKHGQNDFFLRDERQTLRVSLSGEHPFVRQLHAQAQLILDAATVVLSPFGSLDPAGELRCNCEQWRRWRAVDGHETSEVILRGAIDVAVRVRCRPADGEAAQAMLLENVLAELNDETRPCTAGLVEFIAAGHLKSTLLRDYQLTAPTLREVESAAWESGRWELVYRISAPADGL